MKRFVYIAFIAFLGSVAVQGYGTRIHHKHHRPPQRSPHRSPHDEHHGRHEQPQRPHHGLPLSSASNLESEHDRAPWDRPGDGDYGPPSWDCDDDTKSGPPCWYRDEDDDSYRPDEFYDDSDWHHYFHRKRPPKRPPKRTTTTTTKKPRRKTPSTPALTESTTILITPHTNRPPSMSAPPSHIANPQPIQTTIWPMREPSIARSTHGLTPINPPRPTQSKGSIAIETRNTRNSNTPTEAITNWDTTTPPESTTDTDEEEITTLSPEVENCIETCISTPEFNPVCGTNGETYENEGKLFCAQSCGVDVTLRRRSVCPPPIFDGDDDGGFPPPTPPSTSPSFMGRTTPFSSFQICMRQCHITASFTPVCGTDLVTYMNMDRLECAKRCGKDVEVLCEGPCAACGFIPVTVTPKTTTFTPPSSENEGRSTFASEIRNCISTCPMTPEYNPVCGSDHVTYNNPGHLLCAQTCGVAVIVARFSPCSPTTPLTTTTEPPSTTLSPGVRDCIRRCPVTAEYNPVCGTDDLTYTNIGHLNCASHCGIDVELQLKTPCFDDYIELTDITSSSSLPTTIKINENKDGTITASRTTTTPTEFTTPSTTQATTPSKTQETKPVSTLSTTSTPILTTTVGFTIPLDILNDIFGSSTTQPPTTLKTTTKDSDDDVDLDARFGTLSVGTTDPNRIIFPD